VSAATRERLRQLLRGAEPDLAEANLLIAAEAYPRLDISRWLGRVQQLADEAGHTDGVDGVVRTLRASGVVGDRATYDDPRNSFLHEVLDRRVGLPIALSALTVAVARRAGMRLWPVALPGHVIVADLSGESARYLDPFDDWAERTIDECRGIVRVTAGITLAPEHLEPTPPEAIIRRMLVNLTGSYMRREMYGDARWTVELQAIVDPDDTGIKEQLRAFDGLA
jgi:regulator of sirC expression with transglutaminase-like and TPR domain